MGGGDVNECKYKMDYFNGNIKLLNNFGNM